jgi:hypothetical protein
LAGNGIAIQPMPDARSPFPSEHFIRGMNMPEVFSYDHALGERPFLVMSALIAQRHVLSDKHIANSLYVVPLFVLQYGHARLEDILTPFVGDNVRTCHT